METEFIKRSRSRLRAVMCCKNRLHSVWLPMMILQVTLLSSCTKYPQPSFESFEKYYFGFSNSQNMRLAAGEIFPGKIYFNINSSGVTCEDSLLVKFKVMKGGGTISKTSAYSSYESPVDLDWQPGTFTTRQVLRASVFRPEGAYLTSADITIYRLSYNKWDTIPAVFSNSYIRDLIADTVNNVTTALIAGNLYTQGERCFDWVHANDPEPGTSISCLETDTNNIYYASNYNGQLYKSNDQGQSWVKCTMPYNRSSYLYIYVSNDNRLWAHMSDSVIKYSDDGGSVWHKIGSTYTGKVYSQIEAFRMKDGTLLLQGDSWPSLFKSSDNGATWSKITTPDYCQRVFVNEKDEILVWPNSSKHDIYMSTDKGASFNLVHTVYAGSVSTAKNHEFTRCGNFYYVSVRGYGIMKTADCINYQTIFVNDDIDELFIDHKGVLYVRGYDASYYYSSSL